LKHNADNSPTEAPADGGTRPPPADGAGGRVAALRFVVAAALLSGLALSPHLWFPAARSFPRAPLIDALPRAAVPPLEHLLGGLLVAALVAAALAKRPLKYLVAVIISLALFVMLDQTRLQPWVYQYLLIFVIIASGGRHRSGGGEGSQRFVIPALRLVVAALYFWGGVQKLNYSFGREVLPHLLAPLQPVLTLGGSQLAALGVGIALAEIFTGIGLLYGRTRRSCVWLALAMHVLLLGLLIARGYNSVVWAWNAALVPIVVILFRRVDAPTRRVFDGFGAGDRLGRAAQVLAVASALLPASSFWGWWDLYLSGALYSGNTPVAVVRVDGRVYGRLPEAARRQVFETKGGELMLPVFEWSMAELNVPPYPEPRVFRRVAREVCRLAEDGGEVELILKGRPALLDGRYGVTRTGCPQLEE